MKNYRLFTVLLLMLMLGGVVVFGSGVQTPSHRVQTPSLTMDLTSDYGFNPAEARDLVLEHANSRIEYAMENSTSIYDFYLYLLSPDSSIEVKDSCIYLQLSHPRTGETIKRFEPHITIADKKEDSLELLGKMRWKDGRYEFCVNEEKWLVPPRARTHVVYIDIGELKHIRFEVEVTEAGKVKSPE